MGVIIHQVRKLLLYSNRIRVTIIDFRKVGKKGLKNEDKVGQTFIQKRGKSRTEKFVKEGKVGQKSLKNRTIGQKSDYFIKCYQRLTSYIFIFDPKVD